LVKYTTGTGDAYFTRAAEIAMAGLRLKYFVLKPSGNDAYAKASRAAMRTYSRQIEEENPELSKELMEWADDETPILGILDAD